jgi:hypothetical protein
MAIDIDKFVHDQLSVWPAVAAKYRALKSAQTRQMTIGGILVTLQSNPGRMPIFDHGCPLCEENYLEHQHFLPFEGRKGRKYRILVNRAPIFPNHLVITRDVHVPQTIWHRYPDMLDLAVQFPDCVIFYNSPYSGTTVPGHAHFQACPKGYMPMERIAGRLLHNIAMNGGQVPESLSANVSFVDSVRDAQLFHYKHFTRGVFLLRAETAKSMAKMFYRLLDCCDLAEGEAEPRFNALTFFSEGEYRAVVMCRAAHRPHHFYAEGEEHFALSPGAADMAGFSYLNFNYLFYSCTNLASVNGLGNLSGVRSMRYMFSSCAFAAIDFRGFDPSTLTDLFYTFSGCSHLTTIYADASWALPSSGITDSQCFYSCSTSLVGGNGTAWASNKTAYTYFRIDTASTPGYLTSG